MISRGAFARLAVVILMLGWSAGVWANNPFIAPEKKTAPAVKRTRLPFTRRLVRWQKKANARVSMMIRRLKDPASGPPLLLGLIGLVYLYGILHALGPGHGKTVIGTWIIHEPRKGREVVFTAVAAGLLHAAGAALLVGGTYLVLRRATSIGGGHLQHYLQMIAGGIIMLVGVYHFVRAIRREKTNSDGVRQPDGGDPAAASEPRSLSAHPALIALSIGIVPCPMSSVILIFAVSFGMWGRGLLLVAVFALGMITTLLVIGLGLWLSYDRFRRIDNPVVRVLTGRVLPIAAAALFFLIGGVTFLTAM